MATILVIDDEELHREHAAGILRGAGYQVQLAASGKEGLALATAARPDLVICDAMMPDLDGYGVLAQLRADPAMHSVPFAMFTAVRVRGLRTEAKAQGAQDFLNKPYKAGALLEMVRRLIEPPKE